MRWTRPATIPMNTASDKTVPVDLIAGFRGAGKTTLLLQLEKQLWQSERVVFLINEAGKTAVNPADLYPGHFAELWTGGCICCTASSLLEQGLLNALERYHPDRIVVELSETALLSAAAELFRSMPGFRVEHSLYVIDGQSFQRRQLLSAQFIEKQMKAAGCTVVNRQQEDAEEEPMLRRAFRLPSEPSADELRKLYRHSDLQRRLRLVVRQS